MPASSPTSDATPDRARRAARRPSRERRDDRRVVGGLVALPRFHVDLDAGEPLGEGPRREDEVDAQPLVLPEAACSVVPPRERAALVVTEPERVDQAVLEDARECVVLVLREVELTLHRDG